MNDNQQDDHLLSPDPNDELWELAARMCDGKATADQRDRLESLLHDDQDAKSFYVNYLELHAFLRWNWRGVIKVTLPLSERSTPATEERPAARPVLGFLGAATEMVSRPIVFSLIFATVITLGGLMLMGVLPAPNWRADQQAAIEDDGASYRFVARLTRTSDCQWADGGIAKPLGAYLVKGQQLVLERGLAEITYYTGARVILEAPAILVLDSPNGSSLGVGSLTADVPKKARGFKVTTATAEVTDLGTRFGVSTDTSGETEVVVFEGVVIAQSTGSPDTPRKTIRLKKNETASISGKKLTVSKGGLWAHKFVREMPPANLRAKASTEPLRAFTGPKDLNLTGDIVWAINVGGKTAQTVRGVDFLSDSEAEARGAVLRSPIAEDPWEAALTRPEYGDSKDADALETIMDGLRYGSPSKVSVALPVPPGWYRVQLLFSEGVYCGQPRGRKALAHRRVFGIALEERPVVEDLDLIADAQGIRPPKESPTAGVVYTRVLKVNDDILDISFLSSVAVQADKTAFLNGVVVEKMK